MKGLISERNFYFFDGKNRIDIKRGFNKIEDELTENESVQLAIESGYARLGDSQASAPVVDELQAAKDEATFWKACYEEAAAKLEEIGSKGKKAKGVTTVPASPAPEGSTSDPKGAE